MGGGALWTTAPIPQGTTGSNFTSYAGVGIRVLRAGRHGLIASYRLHHISNGNRLRRNPGVNAHMLTHPEAPVRARLLILELGLPGLDGLTLLGQLAEAGVLRSSRAVVVTTRSVEAEMIHCKSKGCMGG